MTTNDSKMTLLQAIAMAGSANKTSLLGRTKLLRKTANGTVDIPVELAAIQKGKLPDVPLEAGDVVFVPFSYMKNVIVGSATLGSSAASALIYAHP